MYCRNEPKIQKTYMQTNNWHKTREIKLKNSRFCAIIFTQIIVKEKSGGAYEV